MKRSVILLFFVLFAAIATPSQSEPSVLDVHFSGNERVATDDLSSNYRDCLGDRWLKPEQELFDYFAQQCSRRVLRNAGFWKSKINTVEFRKDLAIVNVQICVTEGPRYRIGKIKVNGATAISREDILKMFDQKQGDVANGGALQDLVYTNLKEKYDELGYMQYSAEFEPHFNEAADPGLDGTVDVTINIDEGRQFVVRKILFVGGDRRDTELLRHDFPLRPGDIYSSKKMEDAIDAVNARGLFGAIDKDRDVEILTDNEGGDIAVVITLRPLGQ
jgi:outer membrane protein assembly factor BamA